MAYRFANANDRVHYADEIGVFGGAQQFAVACRIRTTQIAGGNHAMIFSHWSGSSSGGYGLMLAAGTGHLFALANGGGAMGIAGSTDMNDGNWHSVVVNYNNASGGANAIYLDGVLYVSGNSSSNWFGAFQYFTIGRSFDSFWGTIQGDVADVARWQRQLTIDEIGALAAGFS